MLKSYQISVLYETLSLMIMKVIIFYKKKFMKESFIISKMFLVSYKVTDYLI